MLQLQGIVNHDQESISTILALSFSLIISPNRSCNQKKHHNSEVAKNTTKGDAFNAEEKKISSQVVVTTQFKKKIFVE